VEFVPDILTPGIILLVNILWMILSRLSSSSQVMMMTNLFQLMLARILKQNIYTTLNDKILGTGNVLDCMTNIHYLGG
jgi:hypothetical protein